ncbi:MAG TPA: hypothetical protein VNZ61_18885 [Roseomonas sp.]|nr:hypothetical protein [Roseomonas sp.]
MTHPHDHWRGAAPHFTERLAEHPDDPALCYLHAQALMLQVKGHIEPLERYAPYYAPDKATLDLRASTTTVFASRNASLQRVTVLGKSKGTVWVGENCSLSNVLINSESSFSTIVFGPNTDLRDCVIQMIGGRTALIVGSGTTIPQGNFLVQEDRAYILIGDDCMFSNGVAARTSDSHGIYDVKTRARINHGKPIVIHNHVWVGRSVNINKGTVIESDAVVGQGAITSGLMRGAAIHAGHPAKPLREGVTWDRTMAESLDECLVVHPSRTRQWNHIRTCEQIDSYAHQPIEGLEPLHAASRMLAASLSDDVVSGYVTSLNYSSRSHDAKLCEDAHGLRRRSTFSKA